MNGYRTRRTRSETVPAQQAGTEALEPRAIPCLLTRITSWPKYRSTKSPPAHPRLWFLPCSRLIASEHQPNRRLWGHRGPYPTETRVYARQVPNKDHLLADPQPRIVIAKPQKQFLRSKNVATAFQEHAQRQGLDAGLRKRQLHPSPNRRLTSTYSTRKWLHFRSVRELALGQGQFLARRMTVHDFTVALFHTTLISRRVPRRPPLHNDAVENEA